MKKQKITAKAISLFLAFLLAAGLTACQSENTENQNAGTENQQEDEKDSILDEATLTCDDISIRDPYVLAEDGIYYLYGTDGDTAFSGEMDSFHVYASEDLENWAGPYTIYENDGSFWADSQYWAPEVYEKDGEYYFYGSMGGSSRENKGIVLFKSDDPLGPFEPVTGDTITPEDVDAIDATLYEEDGTTYMVYSHGTEGIYAVELNDAWDAYAGEPFKLFDVGGCGWATEAFGGMVLNDGPCFYETDSGKLICLFSTMSDNGYKMGYAVSSDGTLNGEWTCSTEQIQTDTDGGHCMLFEDFDGNQVVAYHAPNENSHPVFQYISEDENGNIIFTDR